MAARTTVDRADESWRSAALCAETDPEAFFPEKGESSAAAKNVCDACSVRAQCLEYALRADERYGIWGGLATSARDRLKQGGPEKRTSRAQALRRARDEAIAEMARAGTAPSSIAAQFGVADQTVYRALSRYRTQEQTRSRSTA